MLVSKDKQLCRSVCKQQLKEFWKTRPQLPQLGPRNSHLDTHQTSNQWHHRHQKAKATPLPVSMTDRTAHSEARLVSFIAEHNLPLSIAPHLCDLCKEMSKDPEALVSRTTATYKLVDGLATADHKRIVQKMRNESQLRFFGRYCVQLRLYVVSFWSEIAQFFTRNIQIFAQGSSLIANYVSRTVYFNTAVSEIQYYTFTIHNVPPPPPLPSSLLLPLHSKVIGS